MEFHELADIFPLMGADEFAALRADIAEHGLREPIVLAEGKIADGRNRYLACNELGIESKFGQWDGVGSLLDFIVSMNLHRRHLNESQRAMVAAELANMALGGDRRSDQSLNLDSVSAAQAAEQLSISRAGVFQAKKVLSEGTPELAQAVKQGDVAVSLAAKVAGMNEDNQSRFVEAIKDGTKPNRALTTIRRKSQAEEGEKIILLPENLTLIHGPFQTALDLEAASVDLIFTDPPYSGDTLYLWDDLANFAKRVLKPGGFLLAYSGQSFLPRVIEALSSGLNFYWMISVLHTHGQLRMWGRHVWNSFKPILVFSNGKAQSGWFNDVIAKGESATKELHKWAQPLVQAKMLIPPFCPENGIVVDPMSGGGTIPIAAVLERRIGIGCEIDKDHYNISRSRAEELLNAQKD